MKKLLLSALTVAAALTMNAGTYSVFQNGQLAALTPEPWWNATLTLDAQDPAGSEAKVISFKSADGGAAASMGIDATKDNVAANPQLTTGPLHSATLNFKWYATTAGQEYHIRLTGGVEQDYVFTTTADNINKWNQENLSVAEVFPKVAKAWNEDANNGAGHVFGVTLDKGTAETVIYFDDIYYTNTDESWTAPVKVLPTGMPVPTHAAENVVSIFGSSYDQAANFGIGGWGQTTKTSDVDIEGRKAMKLTTFNYLGFEFGASTIDATKCNTLHVDFYAETEGNFGFTPISPGHERSWIAPEVKVGEWNSYDVPMSYFTGVEFDKIYQFKFDQGNGGQSGYIGNVYFYKDLNIKDPEFGAVWYGTAEGNISLNGTDYPVEFNYNITANADGTLTFETTVEGTEDIPGIGYQICTEGSWKTLSVADGVYSATTDKTFELGHTLSEFFIYMPYQGGAARIDLTYVFGESNEAPVAEPTLKLTASVSDITSNSAVVNYTLKASADFDGVDVKVMLGETVITENPYTINGLTASTPYSYTLTATAELNGVTYTSKPVNVSFTTLRDGAEPAYWHAIADGYLNNAYLPGEDPKTDSRKIPASIETEVIYNPDQTITVNSIYHGQQPVGLVPKITISSGDYKFEYKVMNVDGNKFTITTDTKYPEGENIGWLFYNFAYAGDQTNINVNGYKAGDENEAVSYGDPVAIDLSTVNATPVKDEAQTLTCVVSDANRHFLLDADVTYTISNTVDFTLDGNKLTALRGGTTDLTATCGSATATVKIDCVLNSYAENLYREGETVLTSDHANPALAFDNNEGTQVEWNCQETEEHNLLVDLGAVRGIQMIELVWEGASATEYTVTLSNDAAASRAAGDEVVKVFNVTNGEGGAGTTPRKKLYNEDYHSNKARYVALETKKAFDKGWGIKLKEMRIIGTQDPALGISEIAAKDEAPAVYYNLQGIRVANPTHGIYIVNGKKVYVK